MKYPINIEEWTQGFKEQYPNSRYGVVMLQTVLPMVNKRMSKG